MTKTNNISSELNKKLKELAKWLPKVQQTTVTGRPVFYIDYTGTKLPLLVNHFKKIRRAYMTGGQKAVTEYCKPYTYERKQQTQLK